MGKLIQTGDAQAAYWQGSLTRAEAQKVNDEYADGFENIAKELARLQAMIHNLDFGVQCLAEKLGVTREDIRAFATAKLEAAARNLPTARAKDSLDAPV
jgi:hypothetical protein